MTGKQIKAILAGELPDTRIVCHAGAFEYIHQTAEIFENRSLPCLYVRLDGTQKHITINGRVVYNVPDADKAISILRASGLCAERVSNRLGDIAVIDASQESWPVNTAFGLGDWRTK